MVRRLSDFGSTAQPPHIATRVFAWGLQNACSRSQWRRLRPIVQRNCTPAIWDEMASKFGLDGEGLSPEARPACQTSRRRTLDRAYTDLVHTEVAKMEKKLAQTELLEARLKGMETMIRSMEQTIDMLQRKR